MLTFLFLVSLTATTVLLLAIAAEEVARVTRALFRRADDEVRLNGATASAIAAEPESHAGPDSSELRQFPQRGRAAARVKQPAELDAPDRAA